MRILRRPMFKKGGSANEGIMNGLVDRKGYTEGSSPYEIHQKFKSLGEPIDLREKFEDYYTVPEGTYRDISAGQFGFPVAGQSEWDRADWYAQASAGDIEKEFGAWKTGAGEKLVAQEEEAETIRKEYQASKADTGYPGANIYTPPKKKDDRKDGEKKVVDKRNVLSDRAKEFYRLMSPHATKRLIADVTGAASESLSGSTGDTRQDIVNAITAAAGASGGQRKTYEDAMKLAIGESIQKGIARATYKPNTMETLIALGRSDKPEDKAMYKRHTKGVDADANMLVTLMTKYQGLNTMKRALGDLFEIKANTANAKDYGGTLPADKKGEMADFGKMEKGKIYFNYFDGNFYKLDEKGEETQTAKPAYLESSIPI